jgi:hypothetical protein
LIRRNKFIPIIIIMSMQFLSRSLLLSRKGGCTGPTTATAVVHRFMPNSYWSQMYTKVSPLASLHQHPGCFVALNNNVMMTSIRTFASKKVRYARWMLFEQKMMLPSCTVNVCTYMVFLVKFSFFQYQRHNTKFDTRINKKLYRKRIH